MTNTLLAFVWLLVAAIMPGASRTGGVGEIVPAIAYVCEHDPAPAGWDAKLGAAVLVRMAWDESRFRQWAVGPAKCDSHGDCGAYSAWQVEHRPYLAKDAVAAARFEYDLIRRGAVACPEHPLSLAVGGCFYAGTTKPNRVGRSIADQRLLKSMQLLDAAENWSE